VDIGEPVRLRFPVMSLYRRLKFPQRAENLGQYSSYQVDLAHWIPLSEPFEDRFQGTYERGDASVLLVHGHQGCGKTLFCDRLFSDFSVASSGSFKPNAGNLWHNLVGGSEPTIDVIRDATQNTTLRRIEPDVGWLKREEAFASLDQRYKVRIFLIDDFHLDVFLCELAGVELSWYRALPDKESAKQGFVDSIAEKLVYLCRKTFQRSLFLCVSNRADLFEKLNKSMEDSHRGLALLKELPLPDPSTKERIVRTNINRLNNVSYWYCLDAAGPEEKKRVYQVLQHPDGFTDSFLAIDNALKSRKSAKSGIRRGRPASTNTLSLVTLGANIHDVESFIQIKFGEAQSLPSPTPLFQGTHLALWYFNEWASLLTNGDAEQARRAELTESEFSLCWIALDIESTASLCQQSSANDLGQEIMKEVLMVAPSTNNQKLLESLTRFDTLIPKVLPQSSQQEWIEQFNSLGQRRSSIYEPVLADRARLLGKSYGIAFQTASEVRPDIIVNPYKPCAVTSALDESSINPAIRRLCHTLEFTSFLGPQLKGMEQYILEKSNRYAILLESS
jgi:hypothetical protein